MTKELTATILIKSNQTDPVSHRVLIRDGEYYHTDYGRWMTLPESWQEKARQALDAAARATACE